MTPKDIAARALSETDPALLDQLLALPQAHLVVDGYNVTKTGYPAMPLEKQRLRLLGGLACSRRRRGAEVTCVFDGAELAAPVLLAPPRGVRVLFSKPGVDGGRVDPPAGARRAAGRGRVVVVSTDREVADGVRARPGAAPCASAVAPQAAVPASLRGSERPYRRVGRHVSAVVSANLAHVRIWHAQASLSDGGAPQHQAESVGQRSV